LSPITIGVVGLGYWGPNLARNFAALRGAELAWLCDGRDDVRERFGASFPQARTTRATPS
jgi:predicted dehydrogenase